MRVLRRHLARSRCATVVLVLVTSSGAAQTVTDGDTIKLSGTTYRLWGIDAPETVQSCADGWPAGHEATAKLEQLMAGREISCEPRTTDRYGRTVAVCRADGNDLGAAMVSAGMAYAFTRYSSDYIEQEKSAIRERAGVHAHNCDKPWEWRAQRPRR